MAISAAASHAVTLKVPASLPIQRLRMSDPRKVHGRLAGPAISIAAAAIPAGGKIAVAYPGGTANSSPNRPVAA
jgi:hypothetical protein